MRCCVETDSHVSFPPERKKARSLGTEDAGNNLWKRTEKLTSDGGVSGTGFDTRTFEVSDVERLTVALLALTMFAQAYPPAVSNHVGIGNWLHVPAGVIVFSLFGFNSFPQYITHPRKKQAPQRKNCNRLLCHGFCRHGKPHRKHRRHLR